MSLTAVPDRSALPRWPCSLRSLWLFCRRAAASRSAAASLNRRALLVTVADLAGLDVHSARTIGVLAECGAGVVGCLRAGQAGCARPRRRAMIARSRTTASVAATRAAPRATRVICQPGMPPVVMV